MAAPVPISVHAGRSRWISVGLPVLGVLLCALIAMFARWGPDWPAQEFRAWSASRAGLTAWTNQWYSGVALPGYSVIYPVIAALLGAPLTGVVAAAAAAAGGATMTPSGPRWRQVGYQVSVAIVLAADLLIGQVPYLVGVAFGIWAVWSVRTGRLLLTLVLAAASSLSSPLAGAFLLLVAPAVAAAYGWRRALPLGGAAAGVLVAAGYGGAGGPFPFLGRIVVYVFAFALLAVVLASRPDRWVRVLGLTYGVAAIAVFVLPNPVGGNLARLGQLIALPLAWHLLPRMRWHNRPLAVCLVGLAAIWPIWPSVTSTIRGASDPSRSAGYYAGMVGFLRTQNPTAGRLEVVFTREHWESLYVARVFPIARGWERQTDLAVNRVLYHRMSGAVYRRWLEDNAVSFVALPNVPIDFGGKHEAALLRHPPAYLEPAWHDGHWQVWRVRGSRGLVTGPATVRGLGAASFVLDFTRRGTAHVRIRADSMWVVTSGHGCVGTDRRGWLTASASGPGRLTLRARVGVPATSGGRRCT